MAWTKAGREHEKEMEQMRLVAEADRLHYENEEKNAKQRHEKNRLINDFEFVVDKVMKVASQIVVIGKVTRGCVLKDVDTTVYRKNKLHKQH